MGETRCYTFRSQRENTCVIDKHSVMRRVASKSFAMKSLVRYRVRDHSEGVNGIDEWSGRVS